MIRAAAATRSVLLVAHRLEAARSADQVLVLRAGSIVEHGVARALAHSGGAFAALLAAEAS